VRPPRSPSASRSYSSTSARTGARPHHHRLAHRQPEVVGQGLLEPADPQVRARLDFPVVGRQRPGDQLQQRGLAGAVAPDQAYPLAGLDAELRCGQDDLVAESQRDLVEANAAFMREILSRPLPRSGFIP
jgi:hypothetical protein